MKKIIFGLLFALHILFCNGQYDVALVDFNESQMFDRVSVRRFFDE